MPLNRPEAPSSERPGAVRRSFRAVASGIDRVFGLVTVIAGLAVLSSMPLLSFLSLGYLLEVSGRVAESGRFRDGFVGLRKASAVGNLVVGVFLVLLPVRFVAGMWHDAELIESGGRVAANWRAGAIVVTGLAFLHILWACARGGRLRHFLWPAPLRLVKSAVRRFRGGRSDSEAGVPDRVMAYLAGLRLPHYFVLGFMGFVGAVIWLIVPCGVLILASQIPQPAVAALTNLFGAALLTVAVLYLPFIQAELGRTGKFGSLFQVGVVRGKFRRAPIAFWFALLITLAFALPLYILKVQAIPRDLTWVLALVFVVLIFPARLLTGWSMGRGLRRESPRHWTVRWLSRLAAIPVAGAYVLFVWLTQYVSWDGSAGVLQQHAFMVPAPLFGL